MTDKGKNMSYKKSSPSTIQGMFSKIASRYDLGNKTLSFNLHRVWNKRLVRELVAGVPPSKILDLCAGTGDIAFEFAKQGKAHVTLLDFCAPMLEIARQKAKNLNNGAFTFIEGDATNLPFDENSFSRVSVAYGIRNVLEPLKCVQEAYRVLEPGGTFGILELTLPKNPVMRTLHSFYLNTCVPIIGSLITKDKEAYQYLNQSIKQFKASALEEMLRETGFINVRSHAMTFGVASLVIGTK